jgi:hypothetical protein
MDLNDGFGVGPGEVVDLGWHHHEPAGVEGVRLGWIKLIPHADVDGAGENRDGLGGRMPMCRELVTRIRGFRATKGL